MMRMRRGRKRKTKKKKKKNEKKDEDNVITVIKDEEEILYDVNTLESPDVNMTNKDPTIPTPVPPPNNNDLIIKLIQDTYGQVQVQVQDTYGQVFKALDSLTNQVNEITNKMIELDKCCKDLNYKLQTR